MRCMHFNLVSIGICLLISSNACKNKGVYILIFSNISQTISTLRVIIKYVQFSYFTLRDWHKTKKMFKYRMKYMFKDHIMTSVM